MKHKRNFLILTVLLLSACGGGKETSTSTSHSHEEHSSATSSSEHISTSTSSDQHSSETTSETSSEHSHTVSSEESSIEQEHNYSDSWSFDDEHHWHACIDEGYEDLRKDEAPHHYHPIELDPPTFEDEGFNKYICTICEHVYIEVIPPLEHNYYDEYEYYDNDYHIQYCSDEGYEDLTKKSPHEYDVDITEPTFEMWGLAKYTCKYCGYYYEEDIPPLEHNWGDWTFYNYYDHIRYCVDEGYESWSQTESHDMHEEVIEPTFEEGGHTHHWCSVCGWNYDDTYTNPLEHTYSNVFSHNETHHWRACTDEGYEDLIVDYEEHGTHGHFEEIDVYPTNDAPGHANWQCLQCGYVYNESIVNQKTQGMIFTPIDEGTAYSITGTDMYFNEYSYIPETYNGLPITEIGDRAFKGKSFTTITLPDTVTKIGDEAFMNTELTSIQWGNDIIHIGDNAFKNTKLTSITLPNKLQTIGDSAFENTLITSFDLPESLHNIGERAFANTPISEITLPDNIIETGFAVFSGCYHLTKISLPYFGQTRDLPRYNNSIGSVLAHYFGTDSYTGSTKYTQNYGYDNGILKIDTYIPNGLTDIIIRGGSIVPDYALNRIAGIKNIYLGKSIEHFGGYSFEEMTGLKNVYYEGDITDWACIDTKPTGTITGSSPLINLNNGIILYLEDENGTVQYQGKNFVIPQEVVVNFCEEIPSLFLTGLSQITSVTIKDGVTSIGDFAFNSCVNLKTLIFPDTVTYMGSNVFTQCSNIEVLRLSANAQGAYFGQFCGLKKLRQLYIPSISNSGSVACLGDFFANGDGTQVAQYPFESNTVYTRYIPSNLRDITIASGDVHVGFFSGCNMVEKVTFGEDIAYYGKSMFRANTGIQELVFEQYPFNEDSEAEDTSYSHAGIDRFLLGKLLSRYPFAGGQERIQAFAPADRKHLPESQWYVMYEESTLNICRCYVPTSLKKIEVKNGLVGPYALINLDPVEEVTFGKGVTLSYYSCGDMDNLRVVNLEAGIQFQSSFAGVFDQCPNIETVNFKGTEEQFLAIRDYLGITSTYQVNYVD